MRLDIVPEGPIESLAGLAGLLPASVVKVIWSFSMGRTLLAAVDLGVFPALKDGPATATELAERLQCDRSGMDTLLRALNGFGLLRRRNDTYSLRREPRRYLTDANGTDWSAALRLGAVLDRSMQQLTEAVRTGERKDFHEHLEPDDWDAYLRGLSSMSGMVAKEVVRKVKLPAGVRLLDVGGGHGGFSAAYCKRDGDARAVILDLEGGVAVGEAIVGELELSEQIAFRSGDCRATDWGDGYDAVLLFNLLHNLPEQDASDCVHKAFAALKPGGRLVVLEGQHAGGSGDLSFQEAFGEVLFWVLSQSRTWPAPTLRGWMERAGFTHLRQRGMLTLPGAVLLDAMRPSP